MRLIRQPPLQLSVPSLLCWEFAFERLQSTLCSVTLALLLRLLGLWYVGVGNTKGVYSAKIPSCESFHRANVALL